MRESTLVRLQDAGILIIRVGVGLSYFILHGWAKIIGGPEFWTGLGGAMNNFGISFLPVLWGFLGSFAESVGALLLALGLFTRPAAALLFLGMVVATTSHIVGGDGWAIASHALDMAIVFLGLTLIGPGQFSIDARLKSRKAGWYRKT